ncbi:hypothetical protein RhiJN_09106 [Ceratobasidium sp. AG-Ba]|nr:hypothetical protein RhiJN_09106 [Ceratobasidium sp. AG-Ba]QRW09876.1 hypothetical protein RhiLY_08875 [Ceratobasidium sp. AG-Ba]
MPASAVSDSGSTTSCMVNVSAAHSVTASAEKFSSWATSVSLPYPSDGSVADETALPQDLKDLLRESRVDPSWIENSASDGPENSSSIFIEQRQDLREYDTIQDQFPTMPMIFQVSLPEEFTRSTEDNLSTDVKNTLPWIAGAIGWEANLDLSAPISELERCIALENLAGYVFNIEGKGSFAHKYDLYSKLGGHINR